jgi:hypothetical protein
VDRFFADLARIYRHLIIDRGKEGQFIVLLAFLATFVVVRFITHSIRRGSRLFGNISVGGRHIHHLVPGICLLIVTGYLAIAIDSDVGRRTTAALFGVGTALTLDEFALWLNLRDVYWERQGRRSIDAVLVAAALGGLVLLGGRFWVELGRIIGRLF